LTKPGCDEKGPRDASKIQNASGDGALPKAATAISPQGPPGTE
jgi:hypothetical protein